jgi:hypothetical protein
MPTPPLSVVIRIGRTDVLQITDDESAFFFESGLRIDADGGYHAYHPDGSTGLDHLANAGRPGNWWGIVTHDGTPSGEPVVQGLGDPAPGYYVSATALVDQAIKDPKDPRRYVNSEEINYLALPSGMRIGAKLGDFGVVIRPDKNMQVYAIYADVGPRGKIGEGSIALARSLGISSGPRSGGINNGLVYVVFPGSGNGRPNTSAQIDELAAEAFAAWGGLERVRECLPDLQWA